MTPTFLELPFLYERLHAEGRVKLSANGSDNSKLGCRKCCNGVQTDATTCNRMCKGTQQVVSANNAASVCKGLWGW